MGSEGAGRGNYARFLLARFAATRPGPASLDEYWSDADGIHYPSARPWMFCRDRGVPINPFARLDPKLLAKEWTASLGEGADLQWPAVLYDGSDRRRGNLSVARPNLKPDSLTKEQFQHLGQLRAFPQQQLRNLCRALQEDGLPLQQPEVHTLMLQTLFHVGELEFSRETTAPTTWALPGSAISSAARRACSCGTSWSVRRTCWATPLPASKPCHRCSIWRRTWPASIGRTTPNSARRCFGSSGQELQGLVEEERGRIEAAVCAGHSTEAQLQAMQAKRAVLLAYALRCFQITPLTPQDVAAMIRLSVQLRHATQSAGCG